jgi:hypothetical protein
MQETWVAKNTTASILDAGADASQSRFAKSVATPVGVFEGLVSKLVFERSFAIW